MLIGRLGLRWRRRLRRSVGQLLSVRLEYYRARPFFRYDEQFLCLTCDLLPPNPLRIADRASGLNAPTVRSERLVLSLLLQLVQPGNRRPEAEVPTTIAGKRMQRAGS